MDTGNNGQMLAMNIESIGEVKILTQGYQAEYGRSSGPADHRRHQERHQPVPRIGLRRRARLRLELEHLGQQDERRPEADPGRERLRLLDRRPDRQAGRQQQAVLLLRHEYRPRTRRSTAATRSVCACRPWLERNGDFSQSLDQNGALFAPAEEPDDRPELPRQRDPGERALFARARRSSSGIREPNRTQTAGTNYNYEVAPPQVENLTQQPAIRIDYQLSSKLRLTGKYSGERARRITQPGLIAGFSDVNTPYPVHHQLRRSP